MARLLLSKTANVLLLHETESSAPEMISPYKPTPERDENRMGTPSVSYMDTDFGYGSPAITACPGYHTKGLGYPTDARLCASDPGLQRLGGAPTRPLLFLPTNPQLYSFVQQHPQPPGPLPYYLGTEHGSYQMWEAAPDPIPEPICRLNVMGDDRSVSLGSPVKTQPSPGAFGAVKDTRYCAVCNDYASGYHYGVWSCEGCKAFFKRSLQGRNDYMCPATNQCTIDRNRRKSCQACRLRKCCEVGMMKGGLRKDRRLQDKKEHLEKKHCPLSPRRRVALALEAPNHFSSHQRHGLCIPVEQLLLLLLNAEPPVLCTRQNHGRPYTEVTMMTLLTNLADKELVHMIAWAKKLPGFLELSLHDQVQLLESSWLEVLMIGLVFRSLHSPGKLIFAQDLILDRSEGGCVEGMIEIFDMLLATVSRFRTLQLKPEEFVCLKAIILLNSGAFSFLPSSIETIGGAPAIQYMLDRITDTLAHSIGKSGLSEQRQSRRQAQLLLLLSHIRHMSNKGIEHLYSVKCKNMVPLYDLLLEMLDGHRLRSPFRTEQAKVQAEKVPMSTSMTLRNTLNVPP